MEPARYMSVKQFDILLTDVKDIDITSTLPKRLGVDYLLEEPIECESKGDIIGILFGTNKRPFVNLQFRHFDKKHLVNLVCFVDTGCPGVTLCDASLRALGILSDTRTPGEDFTVHHRGKELEASISTAHYKDFNLIGSSFFVESRAKVTLDYGANKSLIISSLDWEN